MPALRTRDTQVQSLEVTTDAPALPALAIVSPTPRTFTFPANHNLSADSPYSTPSHSPFEPDLRQLTIQTCSSPTQFIRPLSPVDTVSPTSAANHASFAHKRRRSTVGSTSAAAEARPKKGDDGYIKRPENAFILFRRKCCEERQAAMEEAAAEGSGPGKKQRQADLSKAISLQWKNLPADQRQYWEEKAKERKKEHEQLYPNYVYRPQRSKDKDGRSKSRKPTKARRGTELEAETDSESVSFVLPMMARHPSGRSASAPTPPPYQSIQIPNVYSMTPSCPTSPSLLPMISRRSGHPSHCSDEPQLFDYMPSNEPFSFGQAGHFEASLQNPDFMYPPVHGAEPPLLISPSSSSSGPSTPSHSPYTSSSAVLAHSFSQLNASHDPNGFMVPTSMSQAELDLHLEMQMQNDYAAYTWENPQLWPGHVAFGCDPHGDATALLGNDDFDLSAIPPIQLGVVEGNGKEQQPLGLMMDMDMGLSLASGLEATGGEPAVVHPQHAGHLLGFDELMAGHSF